MSKPRVRYRIKHMVFTAAPMAGNSASVELFLEVEEIFVEFIDCTLFYSVTLNWLQR